MAAYRTFADSRMPGDRRIGHSREHQSQHLLLFGGGLGISKYSRSVAMIGGACTRIAPSIALEWK
jgi:hypothetical protein